MEKNSIRDWEEAVLSRIRTSRKKRKIRNIEKSFQGGVDLWDFVLSPDLSFDGSRGNPYSPSPDFLNKLCRTENITGEDSIMDLGCGKGYAIYLMSKFPFGKIYGVELDGTLSQTALSNIGILFPDQLTTRFEIFNVDATQLMNDKYTLDALNRCNYFYIFNSFPPDVAVRVIEEIEESVREHPRRTVIWYVAPGEGCLDRLNSSSVFCLTRKYRFFLYLGTQVYEYANTLESKF